MKIQKITTILEEVEILQAEKAKEGEQACGISITY